MRTILVTVWVPDEFDKDEILEVEQAANEWVRAQYADLFKREKEDGQESV